MEVIIWQTLQPAVLLSLVVKCCNVELSLPPGRGSLSVAGLQRHVVIEKEKGNEAGGRGGRTIIYKPVLYWTWILILISNFI